MGKHKPAQSRRRERRAALGGWYKDTTGNKVLNRATTNFNEVTVESYDMATLGPRKWVNDAIIDSYGAMIEKRDDSVLYITYQQMLKLGQKKAMKTLAEKVDLLQYRLVLFPVNKGNEHWLLVVLNKDNKSLDIYDSLTKDNTKPVEAIKLLMVLSHKIHRPETTLDITNWTTKLMSSLQQTDDFSCGILAIGNMRTAALRCQPYTMEEARKMRIIIAREIQRGIFLH